MLSLPEDRQQLVLLVVAVLLVAAPHALNLAPAVMFFFGLLALWRIAGLYLDVYVPRGLFLFLFTLAGAGIVLGHYHRFWGQEAGSGLLMVGLGLKLMELKNTRDGYLVVFLAFFVVLTQYLFSQSIPMAAYTLAVAVLLVASMIGFNSNTAFPIVERLKMAGFLVALAMPFMVLMFVLFPRIPGPLWQLPDTEHGTRSGLGDTLSPGSVNHLALSGETVFRVDFQGDPPPSNLLYWRGPIFWSTSGVSWSMLPENSTIEGKKPRLIGGVYRYSVTLEPHNRRWVYALDLPEAIPAEFTQTADYQVLAKEDIADRLYYRLSSGTVYQTGPLSESEAQMGLQLPRKISVRLKELARGWSETNTSPDQLVKRALRYFREENFYYTLNPPLLQGDPVDKFLFETRRGFCEHYATAFVVLMRLAGIPSRVVTGYQGGQWNSVGRFLEVRQADAHAWAEVWLPDSGWTRVDPTAAVAPQRIEQGLDVESQIASREIRFNFGKRGTAGEMNFENLWRWGRMAASSINHAWDSWVLAYGPENQGMVLHWLGLFDWRIMAGWLGAALGLFLGISVWLILPKRQAHKDPAQQVYGQFLEKLAFWGLARKTGEGALDFANRIAECAPTMAEYATPITRLYLKIRYEQNQGADDLEIMRLLVDGIPRPHASWRDRLAGRGIGSIWP